MTHRAAICVLCVLVLVSAVGCGRRASNQAGPETGAAPEQEEEGGGGGGTDPDPDPPPEGIGLTSPRVVLGPTFTDTECPHSTESAAGSALLVVEVGCGPSQATTVTLRNDGAEALPSALLEGSVVPDPEFGEPPDLVAVSATSSSGDPCSSGGPTFSCTLGGVDPGSSTEVTVSYQRTQDLNAHFDLALNLRFGSS